MRKRGSGILLHISSLPSDCGIGDLGPGAYEFADFLNRSKQSFWQILPLTLTDPFYGNSPYSSFSAFAGNELFISPELLFEEGLISEAILQESKVPSSYEVDYETASETKKKVLAEACDVFRRSDHKAEYSMFLKENEYWIEDYALFKALKDHYNGAPWYEWSEGERERDAEALDKFKKKKAEKIEKEKIKQFLFFKQWFRLKHYCNEKGVQIIGDLPIYVNHDSAEVWKYPEYFQLDESLMPKFVAGVPPDYFSETGQLWGNPLYDWDRLKNDDYSWWVERLKKNFQVFDITRVDHFRGLIAYWQVPYGSETATGGNWREVPFGDFFNRLLKRFSHLPIIVEDLGTITPDVREVVKDFGLMGMKVLLFAFGEDDPYHPYLPHMYPKDCVAYTGVHDTNTLKGWFDEEANDAERERALGYLGGAVSEDELNWRFIRLLMSSPADYVMIPLQDILSLPSCARMNHPAGGDNWRWRFKKEELTNEIIDKVAELTRIYGRA